MTEYADDRRIGDGKRPRITEGYSAYSPPFQVAPIIEKMLESVPARYLVGLSEVVLTNASGLARERRRSVARARKRKVKILGARGLYHPAWQGREAWIEIFVDNTIKMWERGVWLRFKYSRELALSDVLFHEIDHHIHFTKRREYREKEDVADVWKVRLERHYFANRYPLLRAIVRGFRTPFGPFFDNLSIRSLRMQLRKGWISRVEFEERRKRIRSAE
jgi:hypothetical protein